MKLIEVEREFVVQKTRRGYRAVSWHPHYIMTKWVTSIDRAIQDGDLAVDKYYNQLKNIAGRIDARRRDF